MDKQLNETIYFQEKVLPKYIVDAIKQFIDDVEINKEKYDDSKLWETDRLLGGIGGYCMPPDPLLNPFQGTVEREYFRPLQYARSDIQICDVRLRARNIIHMSGMHLETVCREVLKNGNKFTRLIHYNTTLGKAVKEIEKKKIYDTEIINTLYKFVKLYNMAKHETNSFEERARLFTVEDAVTAYFTVRVLGMKIFEGINISKYNGVYNIDNTMANSYK